MGRRRRIVWIFCFPRHSILSRRFVPVEFLTLVECFCAFWLWWVRTRRLRISKLCIKMQRQIALYSLIIRSKSANNHHTRWSLLVLLLLFFIVVAIFQLFNHKQANRNGIKQCRCGLWWAPHRLLTGLFFYRGYLFHSNWFAFLFFLL